MPKRGRGETKEESNKKPSNTQANKYANRMDRKRRHNGFVGQGPKRHQTNNARQKIVQSRNISAAAKEVTEFAELPRYQSIGQHAKRREALRKHYEEQKQRSKEEAERRQEEAERRQEEAERRRKERMEALEAHMKQMSVNEYNHIYIRF